MQYTIRFKQHLKILFKDQFFYLCLIAIVDSFRFYKDLPEFILHKTPVQGLWFSLGIFEVVKFPLVILSLFFLATASILIFMPYPKRLPMGLLCLGYFLSSFIHFHYWELHHRSHLLLYCLFVLALLPRCDQRARARDLMQGVSLSIYTLAGFWKVRFLVQHLFQPSSLKFGEILPTHIAHFFMRNHEYNSLGELLINSPSLSSLCLGTTIILQFSSLFIYGKRNFYPFWGIAIIGFHLVTYWTMNINFWQMMLVIMVLFIIPFQERFGSQTLEV